MPRTFQLPIETEFKQEMGHKISLLIYEKGLSKPEVAEKIDMNVNTFYQKLYGIKSGFTARELVAISQVLNIDMNELTEGVPY